VYEIIKSLQPYFHSLREINGKVSFDFKLPLTWKFDHIVAQYKTIMFQTQDKNDKYNLVSLITDATKEGYDTGFACANEIIIINKEEEEKRRLFEQKVKELRELFERESLNKLRDINFVESNGQQDTTSIGVVEEGTGEGSESHSS
jgi:hypothetical protein